MVSAYAGAALTIGAVAEYLVRLRIGRAPFSTRWYDVAAGAGVAIAGASAALSDGLWWPVALAGIVAIAWFAATRIVLRMPAREPAVELGAPLPDFDVITSAGAPFSRDDLVAAAPALLVLYRGKW